MKRISALIIISFIVFFATSTNKTISAECPDDVTKEETYPDYYNLPKKQYEAWQKIYEAWFHSEFRECLKKSKIKMKCSKCEYVYMDFAFEIDGNGKIAKYTILKEKMCRTVFTKKLKNCFLDYFLNLEFPKELYNTKFKARLGTGLKC